MAEEISDDKFKAEVIRFIDVANQKFDGLAEGLRTNTFKLDHVDNRLGRVEEKVDRVEEKLDRVDADLKNLTNCFLGGNRQLQGHIQCNRIVARDVGNGHRPKVMHERPMVFLWPPL